MGINKVIDPMIEQKKKRKYIYNTQVKKFILDRYKDDVKEIINERFI